MATMNSCCNDHQEGIKEEIGSENNGIVIIKRHASSNKHVLITGGNQGIGFHTALLLAQQGEYNITIACRSEQRAKKAVKQIQAKNAQIQVGWLQLDLASLKNVQALVEQIRKEKMLFDIVILNAGILLPREKRTEDGFEPTFQVNFLGHFLLIDGIIAHQCPAHSLKVVTLTSIMHRLVGNVFPVEKDPAQWLAMFGNARRWKAYALSKFATALLARHLNDQRGAAVSAVAVHPGAVRTQMANGVGTEKTRKFLFFLKRMLIEPEQAAQNVLFCVENTLDNPSGEYRHASQVQKFPPAVCKQRNVDTLIKMSRTMVEKFGS